MDSSTSIIGEEQTLGCCGNSEGTLVVDENPVIKSMESKTPSRNSADSDEILRGSVAGMLDSDENSGIVENPIKEGVVLESPIMDFCECDDVIVAQMTKTLDVEGIVRNVQFEDSEMDCSKSGETLVECPMVIEIEDNAWIVKTVDEMPKTVQLKNPISGCCQTGEMIDGSLTLDARIVKTVDEMPKTVQLENPVSGCCQTGEMIGGSLTLDAQFRKSLDEIPETTPLGKQFSGCSETGGVTAGGYSVMDGDNVARSLEGIRETAQLKNPVSDCCVTGGIVGGSLSFVASLTNSQDEIPGTMLLENHSSGCCETSGITGGSSVMNDGNVVKSLKKIPETTQLENPVSDCCETGAVLDRSSVIDDTFVDNASTLEHIAQLVSTPNELIQDGVLKVENVELGKHCENVQVEAARVIVDADDYDNDMMGLDDFADHGCSAHSNADTGFSAYGKDIKSDGIIGPTRQCLPEDGDCAPFYDRRLIPKPCGGCHYSDNEYDSDHEFDYRMTGHHLNRDHLNHPYFNNHHLNLPHYRKRDYMPYGWRKRMGFALSEREHKFMMRKNYDYRMRFHEQVRRSGWPDYMHGEAEYSPLFGPNYKDRERGYMERESRWNHNSLGGWSESEIYPVGAGLSNLGNTCFLNAIIQCFTHTVLLVEGLHVLKHEPSSHGQDEFCVLCAVRHQIEGSLKFSGTILSPYNLVDNLDQISSFFRRYQQEDAHEFLLSLLDKLDSNWSKHEVDPEERSSSQNSLVKQVFGGRLVSQLHCCNCGHNSDSYEPLIDLSLEVEDVDDLESAFKSFTTIESMEDIVCGNCKETVVKEKRFLIDQGPPVAAIHLKRFKSDGLRVEKIVRMVKYPLELDLDPYARGAGGENEDLKYELYGFVVHVGLSPTSGHYFCYIRTSPDAWYRFDDSKVTKVSESTALDQEPYILFYARKGTPWFSDLLEKWKSLLQEKAGASPKSVLDPSNLPSSCQDSEQNDRALVVYANPLSCLSLDEADTEFIIPIQESTGASTSNAGDDNKDEETGRAKSENCSKSDVDNSFLYGFENDDGDFNPCITPEPGSPNRNSDKAPTAEQLTYQIPLDHLKTEEKKSSSVKNRFGKCKQGLGIKRAAKYVKSSMHFTRRQIFFANLTANRSESPSIKRRKWDALMHKCPPPKRVKTSRRRARRIVAAN